MIMVNSNYEITNDINIADLIVDAYNSIHVAVKTILSSKPKSEYDISIVKSLYVSHDHSNRQLAWKIMCSLLNYDEIKSITDYYHELLLTNETGNVYGTGTLQCILMDNVNADVRRT